MYIYKITNKITNKIYIGQVYNKSVTDRFNRHIREANPKSKSYIDRSIYKYGKDNFIVEQIDTATSLDELNKKEKYWIKFYNSTNNKYGYNLTPGGEGGNTYLCKSDKELNLIKKKISEKNSGINNGISKQIKAYNINTKQELHFNTLHEACLYFNIIQKAMFTNIINDKAKHWFKNEWTFAYENGEYNMNLTVYDRSCNNGSKIKLIDRESKEEKIFNSINKLSEYLGYSKRMNLNIIKEDFLDQYIIEKI